MSMDTAYVKLSGYHRRADTRSNVEWRIQDSESWPGKLEIAVYGWNSGEELSVATLEPHEVVVLLGALETNTTATVNVADFTTRTFHTWGRPGRETGRWYDGNIQGVTMQTLPLEDREKEVEVDGEKLLKLIPSGMGVRVWAPDSVNAMVEELTLRPSRLAEVVEALKTWLASVPT